MLVHDTLHCHCHCHPQILAGAEEAEEAAAREAKRLVKVAKRQEFFAVQKEKKKALQAEKRVRT